MVAWFDFREFSARRYSASLDGFFPAEDEGVGGQSFSLLSVFGRFTVCGGVFPGLDKEKLRKMFRIFGQSPPLLADDREFGRIHALFCFENSLRPLDVR